MAENRAPRAGGRDFAGGMRQRRTRRKVCNFCANKVEAIDFMVAKKVLRKFESLNLGFMKDELTKFSSYLDKLFGKNTMVICKDYIEQLKKNM